MWSRNLPREDNRIGWSESARHNIDLLRGSLILNKALKIGSSRYLNVLDRPCFRGIYKDSVRVKKVHTSDIGPTAYLGSQHLMNGERPHFALKVAGLRNSLSFQLRGDIVL